MDALVLNDPDIVTHSNGKKLATQALRLATQALHDACLNNIRKFFS
jgi:hypothetical protein